MFSEAQIQSARATPDEQAALERAAREAPNVGDVAGFNVPTGAPAPGGAIYVYDLTTAFLNPLPAVNLLNVGGRPRVSGDGSVIVFVSNR